jgi:hypothetical protein
LAVVRNPHPFEARAVPDAVAQARPRVLQYERPGADREAEKDIRGTVYAMAALVVVLGGGALLAFAGGSRGMGVLLVMAVVFAAGVPAHYWKLQREGLDPSAATVVGVHLVRGCGAVVIALFGVLLLLFGLCAVVIGGGALFHY